MRFLAFIPLLTASLLACTPEASTTTDATTDATTGSTTDSTSEASTGPTGSTGSTTGEPPATTTDASTTDATTEASTTDATTSTTDATTTGTTGEPLDDCEFLAFKLFESDDELECGLGPNGVELCHWTISFTKTAYEHQYSDIGEQGTYTCEGGVIKGIDGGQNPHTGTIDAETGALVWDDVAYHHFI